MEKFESYHDDIFSGLSVNKTVFCINNISLDSKNQAKVQTLVYIFA